ncbi:MAG: hypothetical protein Kow0032_28840 [Methyloligellaceae bacterium]
MAGEKEYRFRIDAYTPETIPMERLAEYMGDLAKILGEPQSVHFVRLEPGSMVLVQTVDEEAVFKVKHRMREVRAGGGPGEAQQAFKRANRRLLEDNAIGVLEDEDGAEIIEFPGRTAVEPVTFGAFNQDGTLDGRIIRLGGRDELVPVHLETAELVFTHCRANRRLAKELGQYIFGPDIRVYGNGRWSRDNLGQWNLERFTISSFEVLGDEPLSAVVARLRDIPGNEWREVKDPWGELEKERNGPEGAH